MAVLPPELEREIFQHALRTSKGDKDGHWNIKWTLSLVCQRVYQWVEFLFYRSLSADDAADTEKLLALLATKPSNFISDTVKELWLGHWVQHHQIIKTITLCNTTEQLACFAEPPADPDLPLLIRQLPLTRLWIEHTHFSKVAASESSESECETPSFLPRLTHLYLIIWERRPVDDEAQLIRDLRCLPSLTHLALACTAHEPALVRTICSALPNLLFLVVPYDHIPSPSEEDEFSYDERIVPIYVDDEEEENDVAGGNLIWEDAESAVAERRLAAVSVMEDLGWPGIAFEPRHS